MDHLGIDHYCKFVNASLTDKSGLMWMRHTKQVWPLLNVLATLVDKQTSSALLSFSCQSPGQSFCAMRTLAACAAVSPDSCTCNQEWGCCARSSMWVGASGSLPGGILLGSSPSTVLSELCCCSVVWPCSFLSQIPWSQCLGCLWSATSLKTSLASPGLSSDPV